MYFDDSIVYSLRIGDNSGSIVEIRKRNKEWREWDESIQGPRPSKPPAHEKSDGYYLSVLFILCTIGIFAYKNKNFITPWIESFNDFSFFNDSDKKNFQGLEIPSSKVNNHNNEQLLNPEEFIIELTPIESNRSGESNTSNQFRAKILNPGEK